MYLFWSWFFPGHGNGARADENPMRDLTASNPCSIREIHTDIPSN